MKLKLAAYLAEAYDAQASENWRKRYDFVRDFHEGLAVVILYGKGWGFVNTEGVEVVEPKYNEVRDFHDGFAAVGLDDKGWGFVNTEGIEVIPLKYDRVGYFHDGFAAVGLDDKGWGFVNTEGVEVVEPKYNEVYNFSDGFAKVYLNGKWGFIDTEGVEIVRLGKYNDEDLKRIGTYLRLGGNLDVILTKFKPITLRALLPQWLRRSQA